MKYLLILALTTILYSCSTQKCYPSKRSKDYAMIKTDGNIIKDYEKATLISMKRTFKGWKLVFLGKDTIVRFSPCPFTVGECYYVLKS